MLFRFRLLFLAVLAAPATAAAQALAPDVTFGTNGQVTTTFPGYDGRVAEVALQPDQKIVVAGSYNGNQDWLVTRYLPSGQLDATFGVSGIQPFNFGFSYEECFAVAVQPDGKILLGGQGNGDYALLRLLPSGQPDATFNGTGRLQLSFGSGNGSTITRLLVQPDGKIVATGFAYNGTDFDFCAARFLANGTLDAAFGTGGKVLVPIGTGRDQGRAALLQPDGKVVIVGETYDGGGSPTFGICRLTAIGALDPTFGTGGKTSTTLQVSSYTLPWAVVRQTDGKLVVAGESNGDVAVARYTTAGVLDTPFGTGGFTITDFSATSQDKIYAVGLQPNGGIVLGGSGFVNRPGGSQDALVVRYTTAGALDTSFGTAGARRFVFGNYSSQFISMAFQVDGKPVFAGNSIAVLNGAVGFGLLRLTSANLTGVADDAAASLADALISPNPLTETSCLTLTLARAAQVAVEVGDVLGRPVGPSAAARPLLPGSHTLALPTALASGLYVVRLTVDGQTRSVRVVRQ